MGAVATATYSVPFIPKLPVFCCCVKKRRSALKQLQLQPLSVSEAEAAERTASRHVELSRRRSCILWFKTHFVLRFRRLVDGSLFDFF